jgi:hypothetical protein
MALESGQVWKEAALRDAHQVPLLTDDALKTNKNRANRVFALFNSI